MVSLARPPATPCTPPLLTVVSAATAPSVTNWIPPLLIVVFRAAPEKLNVKPDSIALMKPEIPPNPTIRAAPAGPNNATLASIALMALAFKEDPKPLNTRNSEDEKTNCSPPPLMIVLSSVPPASWMPPLMTVPIVSPPERTY